MICLKRTVVVALTLVLVAAFLGYTLATVSRPGTFSTGESSSANPEVVVTYKWAEWNVTANLNPGRSFTFKNLTGGYERFTISVEGLTQSSSAVSHDWLYIIISLKVKGVTVIQEVAKIHPDYYIQIITWPPPEGITYRGFTKTYQVNFSEVSVTLYAHFDNYAPIYAYVVCYLTA